MIRINVADMANRERNSRYFRNSDTDCDKNDPFRVVDNSDFQSEVVAKLVDAANSLLDASKLIEARGEDVCFVLKRLTNTTDEMTRDSLMALILVTFTSFRFCSRSNWKATYDFSTNKQLVDCIGYVWYQMLDAIDDKPDWVKGLLRGSRVKSFIQKLCDVMLDE